MPFDHNDHYHPLLLREVPAGGGRALDVGCGTGRFAAALARRGLDVDAVDRDAETVAAARRLHGGGPGPGRLSFRHADITRVPPPPATYDVISCVASLHHIPFATLAALRDALRPGGVLLVLGCYREQSLTDHLTSVAAVAVNTGYRTATAVREALTRPSPPRRPAAPTTAPAMSLEEITEGARDLLPGSEIRRLLLWRYLLIHRTPPGPPSRR
ncbi:class I SAM-dependent methyltransferase [Streptomyces sp. NPDC091377]|uniref:class I SAM-dependent methyltransferase n=1 Tax=Streptomyces sp. NPDC091377 TaxID=3365995 RepID=UPI0038172A92